MTRRAAIDIGTNSTKMTVADVDETGKLTVVAEDSDVTRLGEGVDREKKLTDAAMARTLDAVARFAEAARNAGATDVLAAGTSALRDAKNGEEFIRQVKERVNVTVEIITGDREAKLAYAAVRSDTSLTLGDGPLLVFDVGGGSTELILGDANGVGRHTSLNVGAVRLTERFLHSDPPTEDELAAARQCAEEMLAAFAVPDGSLTVAGIGGTALNVAAVAQKLEKPDPDAVHGRVVTADEVRAALQRFQSVPLAERRQIPGLEPKRADVIIGGSLLLERLLARFSADQFLLSSRGLRYGLLVERV